MPDDLFDLTGHVALITGGNSGVGLGIGRGPRPVRRRRLRLGHQPGEERRRRRPARRARDAHHQPSGRRGGRGRGRRRDGGAHRRVRSARLVLRQRGRGRRAHQSALRRFDPRGMARGDAGQSRRRVLDASRSGPPDDRPGHRRGLVGTASISVEFGAPREEAYAASKAGVIAIIRGLAAELGIAFAPTRCCRAGRSHR